MEIKNTAELIEFVKYLTIETKKIWWFRGHADISWKLQPSIWRDYSKAQEAYMSQEFLFKARTRVVNYPSDKDKSGWISLMQHHELPTRLLDWSKSPLIALYFAANDYHRHSINEKNNDACIWAICPGEMNKFFNHEELIYPLNSKTVRKLINQAYYTDRDENLGVIAASAIETHPRMIMQQSAFTVHSEMEPLENIECSNSWLRKIKIPQQYLADIAIELELIGIKLSSIFPDLDNLSKEIKYLHK